MSAFAKRLLQPTALASHAFASAYQAIREELIDWDKRAMRAAAQFAYWKLTHDLQIPQETEIQSPEEIIKGMEAFFFDYRRLLFSKEPLKPLSEEACSQAQIAFDEACESGILACESFSPGKTVLGWERYDATRLGNYNLRLFRDLPSNYNATLFESKDDDRVILTFDMTHKILPADWQTNAWECCGFGVPVQYQLAGEAAGFLAQKFGTRLKLAGVSKGGNMATYAGLIHRIPYRAFAATGLSLKTREIIGEKRCNQANELGQVFTVRGDVLANPRGDGQPITAWWGGQILGTCHQLDPCYQHMEPLRRKLFASHAKDPCLGLFGALFTAFYHHNPACFGKAPSGRELPCMLGPLSDPQIRDLRTQLGR